MRSTLKSLLEQDQAIEALRKDSPNKNVVKSLQQALFELGFGKEIQWERFGADGDYGEATTTAVKAFAERNGITTDGEKVSPELAEAIVRRHEMVDGLRVLKTALEEGNLESVMVVGSSHKKSVAALQRLLNALGFGEELKWERYGADGDYGGATTAAVAALAKQEELPSDGKSVSAELAERILEKHTPGLGDEWLKARPIAIPTAASTESRRRGQSQFESLFPFSERTTEAIQQELGAEFRFEPLSHEIPGDDFKLEFLQVTKANRNASFYFHEEVPKDKIVLHFTAGQISGDLRTLTPDPGADEVSTAFVVGRDGAIYKLFNSVEAWAYHLGRKTMGGNKPMSATSVGIEVSNWGALKEDGAGNLVTWAKGHWYCTLDQTEAYVKLSRPFRGAQYFAQVTPHQYESIIILLRYLTKKLGIEANFLPKGKRQDTFATHNEARAFKGICSHVNFRTSGKWDFPEEGFDWDKVIEGVTGSFTPALPQGPRTRSIFSIPRVVSEEEVKEQLQGLHLGDQDPDKYGEDGPEVDI